MSRVLYSTPLQLRARGQKPRNYADFECRVMTVITLVFIQVWAKCGQTGLHRKALRRAPALQYYRVALLLVE